MQYTNDFHIKEFSAHLFWDVEKEKLRLEQDKRLIIQRVLEYGFLKDWQLIVKLFGLQEIAKQATKIRDLDKLSLNFISTVSGIPKDDFQCYTTQQSIPKHWNF